MPCSLQCAGDLQQAAGIGRDHGLRARTDDVLRFAVGEFARGLRFDKVVNPG